MRQILLASLVVILALCGCGPSAEQKAAGLTAFTTVEQVFQHPRCRNCHIPGDAPLQFDAGTPHEMNVQRGLDGRGAAGLPCTTCHGQTNAPTSFGVRAPPGAPHWALPPPNQKMAWIGVPAPVLCAMIKDPKQNGGRDLEAMFKHIDEDGLVLWGWNPGGDRAPVSIPHEKFSASFRQWIDAGAPCPQV